MNERPLLVPCLFVACLLIAAVATLPYGYYVLLRWVVTATALYAAWSSFRAKRELWFYFLGLVAIVFNPLLPLHLTREIWQPLDVAAASLFVARAFVRHPDHSGGCCTPTRSSDGECGTDTDYEEGDEE